MSSLGIQQLFREDRFVGIYINTYELLFALIQSSPMNYSGSNTNKFMTYGEAPLLVCAVSLMYLTLIAVCTLCSAIFCCTTTTLLTNLCSTNSFCPNFLMPLFAHTTRHLDCCLLDGPSKFSASL